MPTKKLIQIIIKLASSLNSKEALPQVVITFKGQTDTCLKFMVILLRISENKLDAPSLLELSKILSSKVRFIPERVASIETTKTHTKEANVFTLELEAQPFFNRHGAIDLEKAHDRIVELLEEMVGSINDCSPPFAPLPAIDHEKTIQTLRLHLPRPALSLDPRIGTDRTSGIAIKMLFEGLCRATESDDVELALAESVAISEDKKKYTFQLKESYWSNGAPLTAYDFDYAWKKNLEPDFRSPYSFLFFPIKNAEAVKRGELPINQLGVQALSATTLQVELEYPAPYFLNLTANWIYSPLLHEIDLKHPDWALPSSKNYICNGPFKLEQWQNYDRIEVIKNPLYWDADSVKLDRIQVSVIEDEKEAIKLFFQDKLDWVGDPLSKITPSKINSLKEWDLLESSPEHFGLFWLQLNINQFPLNSSNIRRALAYGTSRQSLIDEVLFSSDLPAFGFAHKPDSAFPPEFKDGDEELALHYFQAGLQELNVTVDQLPPFVICHSDVEEQEAISRALGKQWSHLFGITVNYKKYHWNNYFRSLHSNDLMIGGIAWFTRFCDPIYFYDLFVFKEHAVRLTSWKNRAYSKCVAEAKRTLDPIKKKELLRQAEKILLEEMPLIPLFYQRFRYIKNSRLKGFSFSNSNQIDFRTAYLESA